MNLFWILAAGILYLFGREHAAAVRDFFRGLYRQLLSLAMLALVVALLPCFGELCAPLVRSLPVPSIGWGATLLLVAAYAFFTIVGFLSWTDGASARVERARRDLRAAEQPRRRALPPPPRVFEPETEAGGTGFRPRGRVSRSTHRRPAEVDAADLES